MKSSKNFNQKRSGNEMENKKLKSIGVELKNIGDDIFKKYEALGDQSYSEVNSFFNIKVVVITLFALAGSITLFKLLCH